MLSRLKSLQWRLVFIFISITFALMTAVYVLLNHQVEASFYDNFTSGIERGLEYDYWNTDIKPGLDYLLENAASDTPSTAQKEKLDRSQREIRDRFGLSDSKTCTILDIKNGNRIIYKTESRYNGNDVLLRREIEDSPNFIRALVNKKGDIKRVSHTGGDAFFDYAVTLNNGTLLMYFRYYKSEWGTVTEKFNRILLSSSFFAIIATLIIGYILSKTITVPIMNIAYNARKIARGDFDQNLEVKSSDEIGKLTTTFNFMSSQLKKTLTEVTSEKSKIEAILNNMSEGVVAFNIRGEIIHINPAAISMLDLEDISSISFNAFSEKYNLGARLEDIVYLGSTSFNREKDIEIGTKALRANMALFTDEDEKVEGIILVLHDITELQRLDRMRKEFVANVSHELNTPLTSIKSYAETLLDWAMEDAETANKFLNVINSEAERMTRLVKDLLQLSRLDNSRLRLNRQEISFVKLVKDCMEKVQLEAEGKRQKLESFVIGEIPLLTGDRDRLEQVVLNILSNAIKYTPAEGTITVYIGKTYSEVYIKVSDTGIGIPAEEIPRLFERFYRVDKARSRELGGTGLGLAIAKEIIDGHKGDISIESELGKGTEVIVKLPVQAVTEIV